MKVNHLGAFVFVGVLLAASCGDDSDGNQPAGTGGAPSGGGPGTGGVPSTGGAAAGGGPSGGTSAGGSATGGTSTGGAPTGGASSGGASSGGASSGGAASGGASSGGASSGGAASGGTSSGGASSSGGSSSGALVLTSPVVQDGAKIPAKFRCTGPSPELAWTGGPAALSYAIVLRDVGNGFLHWIIYDLPPSTHSLPEGVPIGYNVAAPAGAHQGKIWNNTVGFNGPCAPSGTSTYEMTLYALDAATLTELSASSTGAAARTAIEGHDTASAKLTILSSP